MPDDTEPLEPATRWFYSPSWGSPWWKPLILDGIHGGTEHGNRTIGLRIPTGALFLCLNIPLRTRPCDE